MKTVLFYSFVSSAIVVVILIEIDYCVDDVAFLYVSVKPGLNPFLLKSVWDGKQECYCRPLRER
jgi:hypothetical protein